MIDFYLIRHAESVANLTPELYCGQSTDIPLTELGSLQAEQRGQSLAASGLRPDVVLSSPARRARMTAEIALKAAGLCTELIIEPALHEVSQGEWEGHNRYEKQTDALLAATAKLGNDFKAPGGESVNDVIRRGRRLLGSFERDYSPEATIFAFTHGFFTRALVGDIQGWDYQTIRDTPTPNTSLTRLQIDPVRDMAWRVLSVGQMEWMEQPA